MREYYSHPGKRLSEHLEEVGRGACARLDNPALRDRRLLRQAAFLIGLSHDLGKYTTYFQNYLSAKRRFEGGLERHGFLGAVLCAWSLQQELDELPDSPCREFLPLIGYLTVHRHHGHLVAPQTIVPRSHHLRSWPAVDVSGEHRRAFHALRRQLQDLQEYREDWEQEWRCLGLVNTIDFVERQPIYELFRELERLAYRLRNLPEEEGVKLCLWGQLLFSALIDSDKFSASALQEPERSELSPDLVERYLRDRYSDSKSEVERLRSEFQRVVRNRTSQLSSGEIAGRVFSLTAPTGLGKTFAALDVALRMRDKLRTFWGLPTGPRIVYALPYINIIEQNYDAFRRLLQHHLSCEDVPERLLLRHHHLAEISYKDPKREDEENLPLDQALLMIESWESEIIVTTFVQLLQTLLGYRNRFLKKLHNLIGALIILDEVQALPMEYWPLTAKVFEALGREMGVVVIQMTATRPLIFNQGTELHPNPPGLFRLQRRTQLHVERAEHPLDDWVDRVASLYEQYGSLLVVVNTIGVALDVYRLLRDRNLAEPFGLQPPDSDAWLVHLSTNLVPKQRSERIEALKGHLKKGGNALVISTQVIEAGVDLDFKAVVRDMGPLDSLVQVAGRCNREGRLDMGHVYVLPLKDGGCTRVYGAVHSYVARRLLEGTEVLKEPEYVRLVDRYFQEVQQRFSQEESERLWKAYQQMAYDRLDSGSLSEFHLIESRDQVPIFVCLDPADERWLMERFKPLVLDTSDSTERRKHYLLFRRQLNDLMIRPMLQRAIRNLPPAVSESGELRWVPHAQLDRFYSAETGFRWLPDELPSAWII